MSSLGIFIQIFVSYPVVLLGRFLIGIAIGLAVTAAPLYSNQY